MDGVQETEGSRDADWGTPVSGGYFRPEFAAFPLTTVEVLCYRRSRLSRCVGLSTGEISFMTTLTRITRPTVCQSVQFSSTLRISCSASAAKQKSR